MTIRTWLPLAASILIAITSADAQSDLHCDNVAHRGFSSIAPENTLVAIDAAIKAGADGCEFDVYGCGDGL